MEGPDSFRNGFQRVAASGTIASAAPTLKIPPSGQPFNIGQIYSEGWRLTKGSKATYNTGLTIIFAVGISLVIIQFIVLGVTGLNGHFVAEQIWMAASQALLTVLGAGMVVVGIRRACGLSISANMVFWPLKDSYGVLLAAIIQTVLTLLGFLLFILPGIYLVLGYYFAIPLVIDRGLGASEALKVSRRTVQPVWFPLFFLVLGMCVIIFLSALPLGIGLFWTIPWAYNVTGVIYRDLFGVDRLAGG